MMETALVVMKRLGRLVLVGASIVVVGLGIGTACIQAFAIGLSAWDDQGYMMLSVRHVLDGHRLYDEVRVFYGPLYYLVRWVIHGPLGLPLTHDAVRLTGLVLRLATATVAASAVLALTRAIVLGALTFLTVNAALTMFASEAGHPQELAILFTVALPLVARSRRPERRVLALGLLVAGLCMIKVNVGAFAAIAVWMALLSSIAAGPAIRLLRVGSLVGCLLLPSVLLHNALSESWARLLASLASAWIATMIPSLLTGRADDLRPVHLLWPSSSAR